MAVTIESAVLVLNAHPPLVQPAELQRPEVHVPDPVVDLLEPHELADADDRHVHPAAVPSNAAVGADVADFETVGVLERWQAIGHRPRRGRVARGRRPLVEGLVRPLVVELVAKHVEGPLLGGEAARGLSGRLRLQGAVHPFMAPVLRGAAGLDELGVNAQAHPPRPTASTTVPRCWWRTAPRCRSESASASRTPGTVG